MRRSALGHLPTVVARTARAVVAVGIGRALGDDSFAFAPPGLLFRAADLLASAPLASADGLLGGFVTIGVVGMLVGWLYVFVSVGVCSVTFGHFHGP